MNDEYIAPSDPDEPIPEQRATTEQAELLRKLRPFIAPAIDDLDNIVNALSMVNCHDDMGEDCPICYLLGNAFQLVELLGKFGIDFDAILERSNET